MIPRGDAVGERSLDRIAHDEVAGHAGAAARLPRDLRRRRPHGDHLPGPADRGRGARGVEVRRGDRPPHHNTPTLHFQDPEGEVAVVLAFFPDPAGTQPNRADLESAVEKDMSLTYFDAPDGGGVYASFTDGNLDPEKVPADEKLISTAGLRSMKGVYVLFTVLTNSRDSASDRRAMDLVRGELRQVKTPVSF